MRRVAAVHRDALGPWKLASTDGPQRRGHRLEALFNIGSCFLVTVFESAGGERRFQVDHGRNSQSDVVLLSQTRTHRNYIGGGHRRSFRSFAIIRVRLVFILCNRNGELFEIRHVDSLR